MNVQSFGHESGNVSWGLVVLGTSLLIGEYLRMRK